MATTKTLLPAPYLTLEDIDGHAIAGGTVTFKVTGTAVLAVVYADADGLVISPNPVTVDAAGRYSVWLTPGDVVDIEYRDAVGTLLKTVPGVMAMPGASGNVDTSGVLGATITAGQVVYLSDGTAGFAGLWYPCLNTLPMVLTVTMGIATTAAASGSTIVIRTAGRVTGLSGLLVGQRYFVGNTAGALALAVPPGTYSRIVGQADTTTSLVLWPNPPAAQPPSQDYAGTGVVAQLVPTAPVVLIKNGGVLLTIQGIKAGYDGQRVRIIQGPNAGQTDFVDNSPAAAAADRLYNVALSAPTSLAVGGGNRGNVDYLYDATIPGWRLVAHEQGGWITPAFVAAHYFANGAMTFTVGAGNIARCAYLLQGRVLRVQLTLINGAVGGTVNTTLSRLIPGGYTSAGASTGPLTGYQQNSSVFLTQAAWSAASSQINFFVNMIATANWIAGNAGLVMDAAIEVN